MVMKLWWFRIPVHPTWHLTVWCGGIVLGLALCAQAWAVHFATWQWLVIGTLLFVFAIGKRWRWLLIIALLGGLLVGMGRGALDVSARNSYDQLIGQEITLRGVVSEDVDTGKRGETVVRLGDITTQYSGLPAQVWVAIDEANSIRRSDVVTIRGQLADGFGSFAASIYRAELVGVERPTPGDVALDVRESFGEQVRESIDEPSASLGMGYLTGQRRDLPEDLDNALRTAGLTHIVVASGYNLTILVRFAKRLFEKRSRYLTVFISGLLILAFIGVTGLSPSMSRAGLVAGLALVAWYLGRKFHPVTLLLFAAAVTGLVTPSYVWGNLGWQLSFAAFAGVMILAPLLQVYFFGDKKPGWLRQILCETISAQIVTAPLLLYSFGYISNVAVIANALVLPLVPLAMVLTFVTGLLGYLSQTIATVVGFPTQWLLDYMVGVATYTANLDWAITEFTLPWWGVLACFVLIIAACWWMRRATGYTLRDASIIE